MKFIYSALILFVLVGCSHRESKYNYFCGLAPSTPTELIIKNNNPEKVITNLLVKEDSLKSIGRIKLGPNEEKQICIENEGEITKGLYFEWNGEYTQVILKSNKLNILYVKESQLKYEDIKQ